MIVLKESQDKIIIFQSTAGINKPLSMQPIPRNVLQCQTSLTRLTCVAKRHASKAATSNLRLCGFFCVTKANLRNAP
jgi:hypothetical protein